MDDLSYFYGCEIKIKNSIVDLKMKKRQLIILIIVLILSSLIAFLYSKKSKLDLEVQKKAIIKAKYQTLIVNNSFINYELTANGVIYELPEENIKFEVAGNLLQGEKELISGDEFVKNQLLFRINNTEAFKVLAEKKNELSLLLKTIMPELESQFPLSKEKWMIFLDEIKPIQRLPELPKDFPPIERTYLISKGFMQFYVKISMLEKEMEKYFYLASFDGKYIESNIEIGEIVESGVTIAKISEKSDVLAKVTINKEDLKIYKSQKHVHFLTKKGAKVGNGEFLSFSKKKRKSNLIEVLYKVQGDSKFTEAGTKLKITTKHTTADKSVSIPFEAVQNNLVKVLVNDKVVSKTITIIGKNASHYFIVGLTDGEQVILKEI